MYVLFHVGLSHKGRIGESFPARAPVRHHDNRGSGRSFEGQITQKLLSVRSDIEEIPGFADHCGLEKDLRRIELKLSFPEMHRSRHELSRAVEVIELFAVTAPSRKSSACTVDPPLTLGPGGQAFE